MQVKLKVLAGKNTGKEIAVPVKRFLIGRGEDCHIRPKSESISRNHCAILVSDAEVVVRDLNSRNGTYVNDTRINDDQVVASGDQLRVGKLEFEIVIEMPAPVPAPRPVAMDESSGSLEFDVTEWLEEADSAAKASRQSDPETRQYKLDETDRIALEKARAEAEEEAAPQEESRKRPEKKAPGKLPTRPASEAATSREAAADMLKKFFNTR